MDALVAFVQANAEWAAPIGFLIGFFKALAFVSLVVPGLTILVAIGALVGASDIAFVPVWLGVSCGAALGDWASYVIGYRLKDRARDIWPLSRRPELLPRAERFFARWGTMSVVLCRFFSPMRATVPLLAGMCEMRFWPFQIANWVSALLWAGVMLGPGTMLADWLR
ncbi:DedA family protein [Rhodovastum atsumiense]|uniref:DedA family protein n=1 Tax=Rhodovastum atsumiense TaxID=504468 RepID=A0A5M6ISG9_9PROT|nr:DedA family protein [Rhodovastum atsumiense]KAA5611254.1 DedA family protein [Rhodovastum atsumiense]CAH2603990.1 DedA family protein [Rhodovastum atsumiense]